LIERLVSPDKEEERIETSSKDNVNGFREAHQEDDHKENAAPFSFHGQSTKRTIKIEIKIEIKRKGKERKGKERKGKEKRKTESKDARGDADHLRSENELNAKVKKDRSLTARPMKRSNLKHARKIDDHIISPQRMTDVRGKNLLFALFYLENGCMIVHCWRDHTFKRLGCVDVCVCVEIGVVLKDGFDMERFLFFFFFLFNLFLRGRFDELSLTLFQILNLKRLLLILAASLCPQCQRFCRAIETSHQIRSDQISLNLVSFSVLLGQTCNQHEKTDGPLEELGIIDHKVSDFVSNVTPASWRILSIRTLVLSGIETAKKGRRERERSMLPSHDDVKDRSHDCRWNAARQGKEHVDLSLRQVNDGEDKRVEDIDRDRHKDAKQNVKAQTLREKERERDRDTCFAPRGRETAREKEGQSVKRRRNAGRR